MPARPGGSLQPVYGAVADLQLAAHDCSLYKGPRTRQLFRLTGLDRRLPPARTLEEALDALMAVRGTPPLARSYGQFGRLF